MNLPNQLTIARLILTAVFVLLFSAGTPNHISWALLIFIVAAITDYFDGEIARRRNLVTNFGKLMDPLADKILMTAALIVVAIPSSKVLHPVPAWIVIAVLAREFFVTGIRQLAAQAGVVLAAEKLGKHKMVWQIITVIYFLLHAASAEPLLAFTAPLFRWAPLSPLYFGNLCLLMMGSLTIISGFSYFWKNRQLFRNS